MTEPTPIHEVDTLEDFVVEWSGDTLCVNFEVWEIVGHCTDGSLLFVRKGATDSGDMVEQAREAEVYAHGCIKWDGCSHVYIGENDDGGGYLHLCGRGSWQAHIAIMAHLWTRAGQLLNTENALTEFKPIVLPEPVG